ncbi:S8 family serine peptidase [Flavitalea sp. BT771]|uniref:S8 family peptidase n=1 Tax=Flavitalea sp. BT771 TaxID=3063329 RepID=UPI0026E1474E|nr:S8 family serine peptidase [Flavitalea sp. BT771]MDO6430824.1 S8 family serine peptidase [Flavitalea sp. BT771]MDV6219036.1 S8 family serine peptidase [Flavitalea sp. BT771]
MAAKKNPIKASERSAKKQAVPPTAVKAPVVKAPGDKVSTGKAPADRSSRPVKEQRFTGRMLVRLDPKVSAASVIRLAKTKGLQLITTSDSGDGSLEQALRQADGIIFEKLRIAVVNEAGIAPLQQLQALRNSPFLSGEPERYLRALHPAPKGKGKGATLKDTTVATWGIHAINVQHNGYTGKGVKIAVLDTGFDFTHPDFTGRTLHRRSFVGTRQAKDKEGHGTHCAGIAGGGRKGRDGARYGVAYGSRLYIGKILDDAGEGTDGQALAGIEWALEKGCQVISMSFGAPAEEGQGHSVVFEQVAQIAMANNCLLIAATGNESDHSEGLVASVNHPANCPSVLAVGALTQDMQVADYSCAGTDLAGGQVDIAAPGDHILSARPGGGYRRESGTSMATAFVAGVAALLWEQHPQAGAGDIWVKLIQQARRLSLPASEVGGGLVYVR